MAHSLWCGEECSKCTKDCNLDMSISCSPDCVGISPVNNIRIESICRGCDSLHDGKNVCNEPYDFGQE